MKFFQTNSYLFGGNAPYVEELYENYLSHPGSVPEQWRAYFDRMQSVPSSSGDILSRDVAHAPIVQSFAERARADGRRCSLGAQAGLCAAVDRRLPLGG